MITDRERGALADALTDNDAALNRLLVEKGVKTDAGRNRR